LQGDGLAEKENSKLFKEECRIRLTQEKISVVLITITETRFKEKRLSETKKILDL
jgi:hypothetical protein